ncbi:MAG: outer membrane lipoprotein carrier protein LolA [Bacteroidetes bacterium]|nr:outer membrane lipoprotein carrier protein LolA [Bacteroidota bacterium]
MLHIILIGLLSLFAVQQPENPLFQSDPRARGILDKTSSEFKQLKTLKADLLITIQVPDKEPYTQSSKVYLKGQSYRLVMKEEEIICDNQSVWRYLKDMNEVQINDYEPADDEITPTNIFNIYENDFYYLYVGSVREDGKQFHEIDLSPMDKDKNYFKVKVWIDEQDDLIRKMKVFDKNGSRYVYAITNLAKNVDLQDTFFEFNKADYPDVWVEDLRF